MSEVSAALTGRIMNKNDLSDSTLSRLSEAAEWLQRLHQYADDKTLLECQRWLDQAVENAEAFERMQTVWQAMGQLAAIERTRSALIDTVAPFGRMTAVHAQCAGRKSLAEMPGVQPSARRCAPATIAAAKPQLPFTLRMSRPPARA